MKHHASDPSRGITSQIIPYILTFIGSFIAAFAIEIFFIPNNLIDGGTVGLAMIAARVFGSTTLPLFLILFNLPFICLAYRFIGKTFVIQLLLAVLSFAFFLFLMPKIFVRPFIGENLEVVVIGGAILGVGIGLIIRAGACLDGTEILGIIINKKQGFTVGQTVFTCNIFVFGTAGLVFQDWHPPLLSLIAFIVVAKIMDMVIVGLDETKLVWVISPKSKEISQAITHELGLGLTILHGKGGFSGAPTEILYIIIERLQLTDLKSLIYTIDPNAFLATENLHEVSSGKQQERVFRKKKPIATVASQALGLDRSPH
jgi:uncharacterized membrane-anchored protein YitT (DUF2179 family)